MKFVVERFQERALDPAQHDFVRQEASFAATSLQAAIDRALQQHPSDGSSEQVGEETT